MSLELSSASVEDEDMFREEESGSMSSCLPGGSLENTNSEAAVQEWFVIESSYSADPEGGGWKLWTRLMATLSSRMPVVVKRAPQLAKAAWRKRRYLGRNDTEATL